MFCFSEYPKEKCAIEDISIPLDLKYSLAFSDLTNPLYKPFKVSSENSSKSGLSSNIPAMISSKLSNASFS